MTFHFLLKGVNNQCGSCHVRAVEPSPDQGGDDSRTKSKNTVHDLYDLQNMSTRKKVCVQVTTGILVPEVSVQENLFFALAQCQWVRRIECRFVGFFLVTETFMHR